MLDNACRNAVRTGQTMAVAAAATAIALGLVWCAAILAHLYHLRRGLDACFVDD